MSATIHPPSEREAKGFYRGLLSHPRLLGRTSTYSWEEATRVEPGPFTFPPRNTLSSIGNHAIRNCWYQIQPAIVQAVGGLDWTSIDVFRIGFDDVPLSQRPVVVWIGVSGSSGEDEDEDDDNDAGDNWASVAQALSQCRAILDAQGLDDVDCQVRASVVSSLAGPPLPPPLPTDQYPTYFHLQTFTTCIGQSLFPLERDTSSGTLGVYLCPSNSSMEAPPLYALTCRHVGLPTDLHPNNTHYHRAQTSQKPLFMGIPGNKAYKNALDTLVYHEDTAASECASDSGADAQTRQANRAKLEAFTRLVRTTKSFESVQDRRIGTLYLAPPIGVGNGAPFPWTRDWCLIHLQRDKFASDDTYPVNAVDIRHHALEEYQLVQLLNPHVQNRQKFRYPKTGILKLQGTISLREMLNPTTLNADGEECFIVGKRGATTGITWGCPSELLSTVRTCLPGGGEFRSMEWAVRGSIEDKYKAFSAPGDSGAAVFDATGRLGGILTGGTGAGRGYVDVTYVTPIEPLKKDIERTLGQPVRFL